MLAVLVYVLLVLVVALAIICGAEYAMLKLNNAEYRAEMARLNYKNKELERKIEDMNRLNGIKGGLN